MFTLEALLEKLGAPDIASITFLVTVNDTYEWIPPFDNSSYACMVTVKTIPLSPDTPMNKTASFTLGNCDNGSLVFTINSDERGKSTVVPTFQSTRIEYVSARTCTIDWNYSYRLPTPTVGTGSMDPAEESLLPGCFTTDSGGPQNYHTTDYWFYILDWDLTSRGVHIYGSKVVFIVTQLHYAARIPGKKYMIMLLHEEGHV